jgi:hypothetical protein
MNATNGNSPPADQSGSSETDEAEIQGMSRMLDDGKGRMCRFSMLDFLPLSIWFRIQGKKVFKSISLTAA